jgi:hypothetical protein
MDRIHYAGDIFLTGTAIAEALLDFARALARGESSESVDIPTVCEDGSIVRTSFLIGPASQLVSEAAVTELDELIDDELVAHLRQRAATFAHDIAVPSHNAVAFVPDAVDELDL